MKIKKSLIPLDSLTQNYLPADYSDVYACNADFKKEISPDDIMVNFWITLPGWVSALFKLRNFLVKFVGLQSSEEDNPDEFIKCIRSGKAYRFISVPAKNTAETVLLLADKHLDAYLSIHIAAGEPDEQGKTVSAITLVNFKNTLGRVYFFFVRPFHALVIKSMLKRALGKAMQ